MWFGSAIVGINELLAEHDYNVLGPSSSERFAAYPAEAMDASSAVLGHCGVG